MKKYEENMQEIFLPYIRTVGLGKFRSFPHIWAVGLGKNSDPTLPLGALGPGKILREAWRRDSKNMKHDLYFLVWLINGREMREFCLEED